MLRIFTLKTEKETQSVLDNIKNSKFIVDKINSKDVRKYPTPPFTTSTLQQEASRKLGFPVKKTMQVAQTLYEGINVGNGAEGLITYMRTDSVNVSKEAISLSREYIEKTYGKNFLPEKPRIFASKKSAQEAHEAIRPTNLIEREPDKNKRFTKY